MKEAGSQGQGRKLRPGGQRRGVPKVGQNEGLLGRVGLRFAGRGGESREQMVQRVKRGEAGQDPDGTVVCSLI